MFLLMSIEFMDGRISLLYARDKCIHLVILYLIGQISSGQPVLVISELVVYLFISQDGVEDKCKRSGEVAKRSGEGFVSPLPNLPVVAVQFAQCLLFCEFLPIELKSGCPMCFVKTPVPDHSASHRLCTHYLFDFFG